MRTWLFSTLLASLCTPLLTTGCTHSVGSNPPPSTLGVNDGQHAAFEGVPSQAAASALPSGARYRVVVDGSRQIALVVIDAGGRIVGRVRIRALDAQGAASAVQLQIDDFEGPELLIEARSDGGLLRGQAQFGEAEASWRVAVGSDGSLQGKGWNAPHRADIQERAALERAAALTEDIAHIVAQLQLVPEIQREAEELVALTRTALDLSSRAWQRRDRAQLAKLHTPV